MYVSIIFTKSVVTDTAVDNSAAVELKPSPVSGVANPLLNRKGVFITNNTAANLYIAMISESSGSPTLSATTFDFLLAQSAYIPLGAFQNVRFFAITDSATPGNVRLTELG